ncbi:phosphoglycerate dehydrogenase [Clostridium sp. D2Q-14]|uniref:phosphoglycerate dehydrogenase n=1 Tax=Anaeromonas gelatinilytica TaxID=2683194 RepID=UPI00193B7A80|nr:phosphoglycerate dehydrogenase [Anaeromonas gelatinilytica]MBS4534275.1 phosphoglycerate dehydrogenase [Anaeromonas gelatinilytica]
MFVKALFTYDYGKEKMKAIEDLGYDIILKKEKDVKLTNDIKDIDILVCYNPFNTLDITKLNTLKWIQLSSTGMDQVPMNILKENNITLTNNKGGYSIPMGEWIVMKILEMLKNSKELYKNQEQKIWKIDTSILELFNKKVGFIGTGSIAQETAKRLQGFEVKVLGLNTKGTDTKYFDKCYSNNEIDKLYRESDIVVISVPYTEKTHHMIDEKAFNKMKDGVYLVNIARGSIINEKDMIKNLKSGKIAKAALDVFEEEPLPKDNELWDLNNVIVTSHNSWISEMKNERRFNTIYENMKRFIQGKELTNKVNIEKGY